MKKETLIAIFFGIILGGVLAVGIIFKNKQDQISKNKAVAPINKITPSVAVTQALVQNLDITQPTSGTIVYEDNVVIKGRTTKGATIFLQSAFKDQVYKTDKQDFEIKFPLAFGENTIKITVYPQDPQEKIQEKELIVYFLEEKL
jgi:hypothetical protein